VSLGGHTASVLRIKHSNSHAWLVIFAETAGGKIDLYDNTYNNNNYNYYYYYYTRLHSG
jgi:hypothetical protein